MLAPHSPPGRHSGGFRPSRKWGEDGRRCFTPRPLRGRSTQDPPEARGTPVAVAKKNAPASAVWSASLLRSVCQKEEEGRGRSEGGATDAAFINMDDFGEGLGARPLLARRACDVPPSVPPRIGLSGCALRAAALAHRLAHVLGFPSVLCPSLAVYNGRPANSIRLVCSRLFWRG